MQTSDHLSPTNMKFGKERACWTLLRIILCKRRIDITTQVRYTGIYTSCEYLYKRHCLLVISYVIFDSMHFDIILYFEFCKCILRPDLMEAFSFLLLQTRHAIISAGMQVCKDSSSHYSSKVAFNPISDKCIWYGNANFRQLTIRILIFMLMSTIPIGFNIVVKLN